MRALAAAAAVWLMALAVACGGGGGAVVPVVQPAAVAVAQPVAVVEPAPAAPAPAASAALVEPARSWAELWAEPWTAPVFGGWVRHSMLQCNGGTADPDRAPENSYLGGATWTAGARNAAPAGGALVIHDFQSGAGWAVLSAAQFDHRQPLRLSGSVDLKPDPWAWLGIALIADETDYREIAVYNDGQAHRVGLWAPCYWQPLVQVQPGRPVELVLEYVPPPGACWRYFVDGVQVHAEACEHRGAALVNPPRVGVYAVNLLAEGQRGTSGYVRATVGPLRVEKGTP